MKYNYSFAFLLLLFLSAGAFAQESERNNNNATEIPLVFNVENRGVGFEKPALPALNDLPLVAHLTDPFMWSATDPHNWTDASIARSTKYADWSKRRAEIAHKIQHYEIGEKPVVHRENIEAAFEAGVLTLTVTNPHNREDGTFLDKLCITNYQYAPEGMGEAYPIISVEYANISPNGSFGLYQNVPNPINDNTTISFEVPERKFVSLQIFILGGIEIAEIVGKFTSQANKV